MCNGAKTSLTCTANPCNSVRGLDFASWRLAYNEVYLSVLTYGLALWDLKAFKNTYYKQVDAAQNQAIRLVSGFIRTAPLESLRKILAISLPVPTR